MIAAVTTAVLCFTFWLPVGRPGKILTTYDPIAALNSGLVRLQSPPAAVSVSSAPAQHAEAPIPRPRAKHRLAPRLHTPIADLAAPSAPAIEGVPKTGPPAKPEVVSLDSYTFDLIRESYEGELSKYPMDGKASAGSVVLRLAGLCRWDGHYIAKVSVTNGAGSDFFVKELSAYAGTEFITARSFFRLFVEAGRTTEGYIVFDPHAGSEVQITLKEDRENGRPLTLPVHYPF